MSVASAIGHVPERRPRAPLLAMAVLALGAAAATAQPSAWLEPRIEQGLAQQMAQRLSEKNLGEPASRLEGARRIVAGVRDELDGLGEAGVLALAPEFAGFTIPTSGQKHLDAMARFQVCNLLLFLQYGNPDSDGDENAQWTAISGLTAITMAIVRLRGALLDAGGEESQIEEHLTGPEMEPILTALQEDDGARATTEDSCGNVLSRLLGFLNR